VVILAWAVTGPIFKFSDTWQLVINTGTTIVCSPSRNVRAARCRA
jgi:low affinity Fe/Cu permease